MIKKNGIKPLTIKEFTKNYKFPENINKISKGEDYIHRTQNKFLSRILKKRIKIPENQDINKTIENLFHNEDCRERLINIVRQRNHKPILTSEGLSISKNNTNDKSYDSLFFDRTKGKKSFDLYTPIKKYHKINLIAKKHKNSDRTITPLVNERNDKNMVIKESKTNISHMNKEKEINKINLDSQLFKRKKIHKKSDTTFSDVYSRTESNKINFDYNKSKNENKINNKKNKVKKSKTLRNTPKKQKKNNKLKIEKLIEISFKNIKEIKTIITTANNYKQEKCEDIFIKQVKAKVNSQNNYKQEKCEEISLIQQIKSKVNSQNNYIPQKCEEIMLKQQIKPIINSSNNYTPEKLEEITLERQIKAKVNSQNNYITQKCEEIILPKQNDDLSNYSGYILYKKNLGKIEEKILIGGEEDKLKENFLNIINEITGEEYTFIIKSESDLINILEEENESKNKKIKEQEILIEQDKKSYLDLKNEFDKLTLENNHLKENINSLEKKEEEIQPSNKSFSECKIEKLEEIQFLEKQTNKIENELDKLTLENNKLKEKINTLEQKEKEIEILNKTFSEYKTKKMEEIQNLEKQIKQYKNELNQIKTEKNKKKEFSIEKIGLFLEKKIDKINNINKIKEYNIENFVISIKPYKDDIKDLEEKLFTSRRKKSEKLSKILDKIKKQKSKETNKTQEIKNNSSTIKKSEKINRIAKMLERQMTGEGEENKKLDNTKEKSSEKEEINFMNLMEGKPLTKNKNKPKLKISFDYDS